MVLVRLPAFPLPYYLPCLYTSHLSLHPSPASLGPQPPPSPSPHHNPELTHHSIIVSLFALVILSSLGGMYKTGHHAVMGSQEDPADGAAVAGAIYGAVVVYAVFLVFCGLQAVLHRREARRGAIALR